MNANKARSKVTGVKLLDEFPSMPPSENGTSENIRKMLQKKKGNDVKMEIENVQLAVNNNVANDTMIIPQANLSQPPPKIENDKILEEIIDYGSMTAAELRKSSAGNDF